MPAAVLLQSLRDLRIAACWLDYGGEDWFDDAADGLDLSPLGALVPHLERLSIDCTAYSGGGGPELALRGAAERLPPGLRSLTASHQGHSSAAFLRGLSALQGLTRLRLPACRLVGAQEVVRGLTQLEELSVEGAGQAVMGLGGMLEPLQALPRLRRLSLAGCDLRHVTAPLTFGGWPALQVRPPARLAGLRP